MTAAKRYSLDPAALAMLTRPRPWAEIEKEADLRKGLALVAALRRNRWGLAATARELAIAPSSLQRLIDSHDLRRQYARHARPVGRPAKTTGETSMVVIASGGRGGGKTQAMESAIADFGGTVYRSERHKKPT